MIANGVKSRIAIEHTCGRERGVMPPSEARYMDGVYKRLLIDKLKEEEIKEDNDSA